MNRFWSKTASDIAPYVPGEQPRDKKYIKLNTNENPYPPSSKVLDAIRRETSADIRLYPDPDAAALKNAIARFYQVDCNEVFVGNGSDEVLAFCFPAFFNPGDIVSFPDITYSFFPVYSRLFGVKYETVRLTDDFLIPVDDFPSGVRGILIPNPNAPTGLAVGTDMIERLLRRFPDTLVIVDEAYVDFGACSSVPLIKKYDNLLVVQTFSKSRSLAGLRVGYAIGNNGLIEALERVKNSFNSYTIDRIAQKAAEAAIDDKEYFYKTLKRVVNTREYTAQKLNGLGFTVIPSKSNFLFVSHKDIKAEEIFIKLRQEGILVRHFKMLRIENWLRITIGTDDDMAALIEKLKAMMI
jgi:histidinol-phosphate aminotransferase